MKEQQLETSNQLDFVVNQQQAYKNCHENPAFEVDKFELIEQTQIPSKGTNNTITTTTTTRNKLIINSLKNNHEAEVQELEEEIRLKQINTKNKRKNNVQTKVEETALQTKEFEYLQTNKNNISKKPKKGAKLLSEFNSSASSTSSSSSYSTKKQFKQNETSTVRLTSCKIVSSSHFYNHHTADRLAAAAAAAASSDISSLIEIPNFGDSFSAMMEQNRIVSFEFCVSFSKKYLFSRPNSKLRGFNIDLNLIDLIIESVY